MKLSRAIILSIVLIVTTFPIALSAATVVWSAGSGTWGTAANWSPATVPAVSTGDAAVISNGSTVSYVPGGDLILSNNGSLSISGGSTWTQSATDWTRLNNGTLTVTGQNSRFIRTNSSGNLVLGFSTATGGEVSAHSLGSVSVGGEIWMGHSSAGQTNQIVSLNLSSGATITGNGSVGLWIWDYDAPGNQFRINFSGGPGSYLQVSDRFGIRPNGGGANNVATWESLWALGILTAVGHSGPTGSNFNDYFTVTGTSAADSTFYRLTLTAIPEPGKSVFLMIGLFLPLIRRRR